MFSREVKRLVCLFLSLAMIFSACAAENFWDDAPATEEDIQSGTEQAIEDSIRDAGDLVNPDPDHAFTAEQQTSYSYTPLDVVLVLDTSGSMASAARGGQQVISLAQEAAVVFVETLFSLSAPSRMGLVSFSTSASRLTQGFLGRTDELELKQLIRRTEANGLTNTGDAFDTARGMIDGSSRPEARQVVVMLTDGVPEDGYGNPVQQSISAGRSLAGTGALVYTVGLVGALQDSAKRIARQVLNDGYETRYFEVDNKKGATGEQRDMGRYTYISAEDIAKELADIFKAICMAAMADGDGANSYTVWAGENMDIRVTDGQGNYLSSDPSDYCEKAPFGHMSIVGEGKNQKSVILSDGDYVITLRGLTTGRSGYRLTRLTGLRMKPEDLAYQKSVNTHPAQVLRFVIRDGVCELTDLSWDPLDHKATDLFTGKPTRGSETAASGRLTKAESLFAWMSKKALKLLSLKKSHYVQTLASDPDVSWYLVATTDEDGRLIRGWVPAGAVTVDGYVPVLVTDEPKGYTVRDTADAMTAPAGSAAPARQVASGETVTAVHAERDSEGREWAYVRLNGKKDQAAWIEADKLDGWQPVSPEGFRIGYALPTLVWQKIIGGKGFTEFMWAAPRADGSGTAISGRSSSTGGEIRAKYKNRDAVALLLGPDGRIERSAVLGGTGSLDSFHCILPVADGFYVSGVTRSNNNDFEGIWDTDTFSGKIKSKFDRANALIGKLDQDLNIVWMKSFGTGSASFGFDMVVETADGMIAGSGWLTANSSFALRGKGRQDFLVVKLDRNGRVVGYNNYGGSGEDVPDSAVVTADGGLILVGNEGGDKKGTGLIYLVDADLREKKRVTYGGSSTDVFDNIRDLGDGTYLATGFSGSYSPSVDFWAMQIDGSGRMIWTKNYGGSGREEVCGTTVLPGGNCLLVGYTTSTDGSVQGGTGRGKDAWAVCIDQRGRLLWQFTGGLNGDDYFNSACVDPADGGIVLCGTCEYKNDKSAKGYAVKILMPQALR